MQNFPLRIIVSVLFVIGGSGTGILLGVHYKKISTDQNSAYSPPTILAPVNTLVALEDIPLSPLPSVAPPTIFSKKPQIAPVASTPMPKELKRTMHIPTPVMSSPFSSSSDLTPIAVITPPVAVIPVSPTPSQLCPQYISLVSEAQQKIADINVKISEVYNTSSAAGSWAMAGNVYAQQQANIVPLDEELNKARASYALNLSLERQARCSVNN